MLRDLTPAVRAGLALVFAMLLVADGALWSLGFARGDIEGTELRVTPEAMDGREVLLSLVDVVSLDSGGYSVRDGKRILTVIGDPGALGVGDEIYLRGVYDHPTTTIDEIWREEAPDRKSKWAFGILGLGLTCLGLPLGFGASARGLTIRG